MGLLCSSHGDEDGQHSNTPTYAIMNMLQEARENSIRAVDFIVDRWYLPDMDSGESVRRTASPSTSRSKLDRPCSASSSKLKKASTALRTQAVSHVDDYAILDNINEMEQIGAYLWALTEDELQPDELILSDHKDLGTRGLTLRGVERMLPELCENHLIRKSAPKLSFSKHKAAHAKLLNSVQKRWYFIAADFSEEVSKLRDKYLGSCGMYCELWLRYNAKQPLMRSTITCLARFIRYLALENGKCCTRYTASFASIVDNGGTPREWQMKTHRFIAKLQRNMTSGLGRSSNSFVSKAGQPHARSGSRISRLSKAQSFASTLQNSPYLQAAIASGRIERPDEDNVQVHDVEMKVQQPHHVDKKKGVPSSRNPRARPNHPPSSRHPAGPVDAKAEKKVASKPRRTGWAGHDTANKEQNPLNVPRLVIPGR